MDSNILFKSGGILIKDRKFILERHGGKETYILPGGKLELDETPEQALIRELYEEFGVHVESQDLEEFGIFESQAIHNPDKKVNVTAFIVKKWEGGIRLQDGIEGVIWVNSVNVASIEVSLIVKQIVSLLVKQGLVD